MHRFVKMEAVIVVIATVYVYCNWKLEEARKDVHHRADTSILDFYPLPEMWENESILF